MVYPTLDEATQRALNELSETELRHSTYDHEILWYGVDAVAHVHLMQMAKRIAEGKISIEDFMEKYGLDFGERPIKFYDQVLAFEGGFSGLLKAIENDGIFIPQQAYRITHGKAERLIQFFGGDYFNLIRKSSWTNKDYANALIRRKWQPLDLKSPEIIEQGVRFGRDMWKTCVEGFEIIQRGGKYGEPQPQHITDLGRKLIAYYSTIVGN